MIISDLIGKYNGGGDYLAPTSCQSDTCYTNHGDGHVHYTSLPTRHGFNTNLQYSGVGESYGARLFQAQGRGQFGKSPLAQAQPGNVVDSTNYGAWLDYSSFWVTLENVQSGTLGGIDLAGWQTAYSTSFGDHTGSRPTANATWKGTVVGSADYVGSPIAPRAFQGDVSASYNVGSNFLSMAFNSVVYLDRPKEFVRAFPFAVSLLVNADGSFKTHPATATRISYMEGRFYGPGHTEVGGIFTENTRSNTGVRVIGAFGAKRQ